MVKSRFLRLALLLPVMFSGLPGFGADLQAIFQKLQRVPRDYRVFGTVCEEAARVMLAEKYPEPTYTIETSIEYADKSRVVGELDVVVLDRSNSEAVLIAEVKCWSGLGRAHAKAVSQLGRFTQTVGSNDRISIYSRSSNYTTSDKKTYSTTQFDNHPETITISQKGGLDHGFDLELDYTLEQMSAVRDMLLACYEKGACPKKDPS